MEISFQKSQAVMLPSADKSACFSLLCTRLLATVIISDCCWLPSLPTFWKNRETFKAMGKPTESQRSSLLYSLLWKKITNKQKTESYFWMQLCIWKDFKWSLFLSFSQSMTNSYSANLYFSNTVSTSLTLSALSKAAHRYSWCTEIS